MIQKQIPLRSFNNHVARDIIKELELHLSDEQITYRMCRDIHRCYMENIMDEIHERRVVNLCHVDSTYKLKITEDDVAELNAIGYRFKDIFTERLMRVK